MADSAPTLRIYRGPTKCAGQNRAARFAPRTPGNRPGAPLRHEQQGRRYSIQPPCYASAHGRRMPANPQIDYHTELEHFHAGRALREGTAGLPQPPA